MKGRNARLKIIKRLINENHIKSQEQLLQHLEEENVMVTQATLSRDLKLLKVGKVSDGVKGYHYSLPSGQQLKENEQEFIQDLVRGFISIDFSHNLAVIRTLPGHANSVALAFDNFDISVALGTIAGDDTILVVMKEDISAREFLDALKKKIPDLDV